MGRWQVRRNMARGDGPVERFGTCAESADAVPFGTLPALLPLGT